MSVRRTNTFDIVARSEQDEDLLRRLLDASAALWNEITYERRQSYTDPDGDVWEADAPCDRYVGILGTRTVQTIRRVNDEAWRSFFALKRKGEPADLPGFWGNREEGRDLRTFIRNDSYTLEWGERSRLELLIGKDLKQEYGIGSNDRFRLGVRGDPKWKQYVKQGRLSIHFEAISGQYCVHQPVTIDETQLETPLADESAALDIGTNILVACTTTTGRQYLYDGLDLFERFRETTEEIARLTSLLGPGQSSSRRIRELYRRRTRRRDHAQHTLCRDLVDRLHDEGVSTIYVGDLTGVLETHWSTRTNEKTHNFWAFRAFTDHLSHTAEEYGITVEKRSEAWTSQLCPYCESTDWTTRQGGILTCHCGFEGHVDLTASETFLRRHETIVRPMARPVCLMWDDHRWSESPRSRRPSEEHTNP